MTQQVPSAEPIVFDCEGEWLVGMVHPAAEPRPLGVLCVVAGGPQYRAGVGRSMLATGRRLAAEGVPVMRFDYRGMGDSSGAFRGFQHVGEDLAAAISAFKRAVPGLEQVVLWGGCDAASAIMIHAYQLDSVVAIALGNPWVSNSETQAAVMRKHYLSRLREKSFWLKVVRLQYRPGDYLQGALGKIRNRLSHASSRASEPAGTSGTDQPSPSGNFVARMLSGLQRFDGPMMLVMSGASLFSREFDELLEQRPEWAAAVDAKLARRLDLPEADQTFSNQGAREEVNRALCHWVSDVAGAAPEAPA